jgi:4-amino-4-deoxy-L-arabinose transferase-like glycosyltransferase
MRLILPGSRWPLFALAAALRLVHLQAPILGVHSWRQADTAALARNAYEQGLPFWLPQVDWGGVGSGIAETDPPIYSMAVALLYQLAGPHEWLARGLSLLFSLAALGLLLRLGEELLGAEAGWWGGLFFAVLPLSVFYGRTVQPESLLLFCAALALERGLAWRRRGKPLDLALAGISLATAVLIKVLPLFWLGLPLLWLAWLRYGKNLWRRWEIWLTLALVLAVSIGWYAHAHQIFLQTGLSFGFWGAGANRYSWGDLLGFSYWGEILLRSSLRGLALFGLPLLLLGLLLPRQSAEEWLLSIGLAGVLLAGALAPGSSRVHEYYQLPALLFVCPLLGKAWVNLWYRAQRRGRALLRIGLALLMAVSLGVLSLDYWRLESTGGNATWALAQQVQRQTPSGAKIVSVTGGDPTLLYLAHRKGWLADPSVVNAAWLNERAREGATHVAGSWEVIQSYAPFAPGAEKTRLQRLLGAGDNYVVPLPINDAPDPPKR